MNLENKVNMLVDSYLEPPKLSAKSMYNHVQDLKDELFKPYLIRSVFNNICPKLLRFMDEEKALGVLESILNGYITIPNMEYVYTRDNYTTEVPVIDMLHYTNSISNIISNLFSIINMYKYSGVSEIIITNIIPFLMLYKVSLGVEIKKLELRTIYIQLIRLIFAPLMPINRDTDTNNITIVIDDYKHNKDILRNNISKFFSCLKNSKKEKLLSKKEYLQTLLHVKNLVSSRSTTFPKVQLLYPVTKMRNLKAKSFLEFLGVTVNKESELKHIYTDRDVYNLYITYRELSDEMLTFEEFEEKFIPYCDGNPDGFMLDNPNSRIIKKLANMNVDVCNVQDYYWVPRDTTCYSVCIDMERVMDFCKDLDMVKTMIRDLYLNAQYINLSIVASLNFASNPVVCVHFVNTDIEIQQYIPDIVKAIDIYLIDKHKYKVTYKYDIRNGYGRVIG